MNTALLLIGALAALPLSATILTYGINDFAAWSTKAQLVGGVNYVPVTETFPNNQLSVPGLSVCNSSGEVGGPCFAGDSITNNTYHGLDGHHAGIFDDARTLFTIPVGTIGIGFDFSNDAPTYPLNEVTIIADFADGSSYYYQFPNAPYDGFYGLISTGPLLTTVAFVDGFWNASSINLPDPVSLLGLPEPSTLPMLFFGALALWAVRQSIKYRWVLRCLHR